jgi:hypothetical protein
MTDKEKVEQMEKDLANCRMTIEGIIKELFVLQQEIMVINPEWKEYLNNDP